MPAKIDELLKVKRQDILGTAARHGAHNLRVFGSVARGEAGSDSHRNTLVDMDPEKSLMDHVALMQGLEDISVKSGCSQRKGAALVYSGHGTC